MEAGDGSSSGLLFIDVDAKPLIPYIPIIKEERASSPDETLSDVKKDKGEKLNCTECPKYTCDSEEKLLRHIRRAHRGLKPFQCSLCEYSTTNSVMFEEHVNIHQGIKPYQCKHCPYRSVSRKYIKFHERKHGVCEKCGYLAQNTRALKKHKKESGCQQDTGKKTSYECKPCKHKFDNDLSLRMHKKGHKKCPNCPLTFCRSVLSVHMAKVHGEEVKNKFKCAQCEWSSNTKQKILLHMIHHPEQVLDGSIDVTPLIETGILTKAVNTAT